MFKAKSYNGAHETLARSRQRWQSKPEWRGEYMEPNWTAVMKQDGDWWVGWIEELPGVNALERTRDELVDSLRIALGEALDFNRAEAPDAAGGGYEVLKIAV
jgi:hypothetical protein